MITRVKICGITRAEDAEAAADLGAAAVGFIFVKNSPRSIDPDKARHIIHALPPFVTPVGVLADTSRAEALAAIAKSGVRCLQLHGKEDSREFADLPIPVYRVYRVSPEFDPATLKENGGSTFMLDTFVDGIAGGTGTTFDWKIAIEAKQFGRLILSGGINPENVAEAIRRVAPYAIDVSSGVERSPGVKDYQKMQSLFEAIRRVEVTHS
ncbi:MAG TPA: phosphoribosylanthranilate isomerase [Bacteroidota bacterium]